METSADPAGSEFVVVTTTAADRNWLTGCVRGLVADQLIACANIVPDVASSYRWEGQVTEEREALAIMHTTRDRLELLRQRLAAEHPYDVPQVVALRAEAAPSYHEWVRASVR